MTSHSKPAALVTGGTTGIGLATAKLLIERGYSLLVTGQNPGTLAAACLGMPNHVSYTGTKGAVVSMVRALAVELAARGIRVNSISPGPVDTPVFTKIGLSPGQVAEMRRAIATRVPLGRFGTDREIAEAVAFLASPAAGYITGIDLAVDGGMSVA